MIIYRRVTSQIMTLGSKFVNIRVWHLVHARTQDGWYSNVWEPWTKCHSNPWPPIIFEVSLGQDSKSEVKRFQRKCLTIWRQDLINSLFLYKLTITRYHTKYIKNDKFTFYVLSKCKFITIRFIYLFDVLLTDIADLRIKNTD